MANTILLKGRDKVTRKEYVAGTAINPGYLLALAADGEVDPHAAAAENQSSMFAFENELAGEEITDAYSVGDQVLCMVCAPGVEILAVLAASADAIVIGVYLESAGDGTLRVLTTAAATEESERRSVVGMALEAVDNSGGGTEVFIKMEVL
jgi:hypothetical protein